MDMKSKSFQIYRQSKNKKSATKIIDVKRDSNNPNNKPQSGCSHCKLRPSAYVEAAVKSSVTAAKKKQDWCEMLSQTLDDCCCCCYVLKRYLREVFTLNIFCCNNELVIAALLKDLIDMTSCVCKDCYRLIKKIIFTTTSFTVVSNHNLRSRSANNCGDNTEARRRSKKSGDNKKSGKSSSSTPNIQVIEDCCACCRAMQKYLCNVLSLNIFCRNEEAVLFNSLKDVFYLSGAICKDCCQVLCSLIGIGNSMPNKNKGNRGHSFWRKKETYQSSTEQMPPYGEAAKPNDEAAKPNDEAAKPDDEAAKPDDEAAKPNDEAAKPNDEAATPNDEAAKPNDEAATPNNEDAKPDALEK